MTRIVRLETCSSLCVDVGLKMGSSCLAIQSKTREEQLQIPMLISRFAALSGRKLQKEEGPHA